MKKIGLLSAALISIALLTVPLLPAGAWSLNPFASNTDSTTTLKNPAVKTTPQPSILQKVGAGTANLVSAVGNTIIPKSPTATQKTSQFNLGSHQVTPSAAQVQSLGNGTPSSATGTFIRSQAPSKRVQSAADWVNLQRPGQ